MVIHKGYVCTSLFIRSLHMVTEVSKWELKWGDLKGLYKSFIMDLRARGSSLSEACSKVPEIFSAVRITSHFWKFHTDLSLPINSTSYHHTY